MLVSWGPVSLPRDLPRGRARDLDGKELDALVEFSGRRAAEQEKAARGARSKSGSRGRRPARKKAGPRSGGR
jgi:hypothetical protein